MCAGSNGGVAQFPLTPPTLRSLWLLPGALMLLIEPAQWLARTWYDPAYDSAGGWVALAVAALVVRSVLSGPRAGGVDPRARRLAWGLLLGCAAIRLAGRVLAINILGAFAITLDVWALGLLLGLSRRPWALSPAAVAGLFAFSLPIQFVLQRLLGYPLRYGAAVAAEGMLGAVFEGITREGTLVTGPAAQLSVDLPCSGAQGLTLLLALALALCARRRAGAVGLATGLLAAAGGAFAGNAARVALIYAAIAAGAPASTEPWHSLIGLVALAPAAAPLLLLAGWWPARRPPRDSQRSASPAASPSRPGRAARPLAAVSGLAVLAVAAVISAAPQHPVDVGDTGGAQRLPRVLGDRVGEPIPLSEEERDYFQRFGGEVEKITYRDPDGVGHTVLRVRTTAPLRHLHDPDVCLRGAGHTLERLGVRAAPLPGVVWHSTDTAGREWRIEASFVSAAGERAAAVSEVTWRWLQSPGDAWTLLERGSPWRVCEAEPERCEDFNRDLLSALDLHQPLTLVSP